MRLINDRTLEEISKAEKCDISSVVESIEGAIKIIRKKF